MTYPYAVKFNGKWYRPGENVPDNTVKQPEKVIEAVEESAIQPVVPQIEEVQPETVVEGEPKRRRRRRKSE